MIIFFTKIKILLNLENGLIIAKFITQNQNSYQLYEEQNKETLHCKRKNKYVFCDNEKGIAVGVARIRKSKSQGGWSG